MEERVVATALCRRNTRRQQITRSYADRAASLQQRVRHNSFSFVRSCESTMPTGAW